MQQSPEPPPKFDAYATNYRTLVEQSIDVPGPDVERLGKAARAAGIYAAVGVNEREPEGSTIYNTILYFGPDGRLLGNIGS